MFQRTASIPISEPLGYIFSACVFKNKRPAESLFSSPVFCLFPSFLLPPSSQMNGGWNFCPLHSSKSSQYIHVFPQVNLRGPSLSLTRQSILFLRQSFTCLKTYFFGIPTQTDNQQLPRNPPGLQSQVRTVETFFLLS